MNKLTLSALGALLVGSLAHAQGVFYVYATDATNGSVLNGGAVAGAAPITRFVTDDITIDPLWTGMSIRHIGFNVVNTSTLPISARPRGRFHQNNGTGVGPTGFNDPLTYITGFTFNAISFNPGNNYYYGTVGVPGIVIPASNKFWYGWTFDNNSNATGATDADLNMLGVGSAVANAGLSGLVTSSDAIFTSTNPGSFVGNMGPGAQTLLTPAGSTLDLWLGLMSQDYTFDLTLGDVTSTAYAKTLDITVSAGTTMLASYYVITFAPATNTASLAVRVPHQLPTGVSGPVTITIDGGQFLKNKIDVTLPAAPNDAPVAIVIPNEVMTNGDVDNSGEVDAADIDQVIADFGAPVAAETDPAANSDVDCSGEVDAADIDIVIANFGGMDD